jgi:hypothetical protein
VIQVCPGHISSVHACLPQQQAQSPIDHGSPAVAGGMPRRPTLGAALTAPSTVASPHIQALLRAAITRGQARCCGLQPCSQAPAHSNCSGDRQTHTAEAGATSIWGLSASCPRYALQLKGEKRDKKGNHPAPYCATLLGTGSHPTHIPA